MVETIKKRARRERIENAAYDVLLENGYKATTLLAIATHAGTSNETLNEWYGNKAGLYASIIKTRLNNWLTSISSVIELQGDTVEELRLLGPMLLKLVTDDLAIALTRAAVVDAKETCTLGPLLHEQDKAIEVVVSQLVETGLRRSTFSGASAGDITKTYTSVLFGNVQLLGAIGVLEPLQERQREARAELACDALERMYRTLRSPDPATGAFAQNRV